MPIPLAQLDTWSHQGAIAQSAYTYNVIKQALESPRAHYQVRNFKVFLQGSYGNDTNIYSESDVDIVICYEGAFFHDATDLPAPQPAAFAAAFPTEGVYPYNDFKAHVRTALEAAFGSSVKPGGNKAIKVEASGARRGADVIVAFQFHRYFRFNGLHDESHVTGISFFAPSFLPGLKPISNYPKQHSENCTIKHTQTGYNFKPVVRILKNIRTKLVADGMLRAGDAPSYFIEGLLYNVPNTAFVGNYQTIVQNVISSLLATTDKSNFTTPSEQHWLIRDGFHECWPTMNAQRFISEVARLWENWR